MAMMAVMNLNPIDSNLHFKLIFLAPCVRRCCVCTRRGLGNAEKNFKKKIRVKKLFSNSVRIALCEI